MRVFLETERLILRRFTGDDADNLVELDADPEVMRFLTGGRPTPREEIRDNLLPRLLRRYERGAGFGLWAAVEKSTGVFLGWFGFRPPEGDGPDEVELGYRLRRSGWSKGYATEGSRALIRKGFAELGVRRVTAQTMAVNAAASRRVMEKAGLDPPKSLPRGVAGAHRGGRARRGRVHPDEGRTGAAGTGETRTARGRRGTVESGRVRRSPGDRLLPLAADRLSHQAVCPPSTTMVWPVM